jgi:hypothetical protein
MVPKFWKGLPKWAITATIRYKGSQQDKPNKDVPICHVVTITNNFTTPYLVHIASWNHIPMLRNVEITVHGDGPITVLLVTKWMEPGAHP